MSNSKHTITQYNQVSHNTNSFEKNPSQSQTERTQNIFGQTGAFVFLSPIHATGIPFGDDLMRFHLSSSLKRRNADESGCFHLSTQKMECLSQLAVTVTSQSRSRILKSKFEVIGVHILAHKPVPSVCFHIVLFLNKVSRLLRSQSLM